MQDMEPMDSATATRPSSGHFDNISRGPSIDDVDEALDEDEEAGASDDEGDGDVQDDIKEKRWVPTIEAAQYAHRQINLCILFVILT
ncbi:hypothetical protein H0H92_001308, partial [Tricholoma furcatifolium]